MMDLFLHYRKDKSLADQLLYRACDELNIDSTDHQLIYDHIYDIVRVIEKYNNENTIAVGTTGTITERLCEAGLLSSVSTTYDKLPGDWKWVGDFYIESIPFNVIVSVKSFKAKERLLSSGSGNYLSPTIGFGLFNDETEFTLKRISKYPFRAFLGIYMPSLLYEQLDDSVIQLKNINHKPFIRKLEDFVEDLQQSKNQNGKLDITNI